MKKSRFTTEQIIGILKENEAGAKASDLARKHGVAEHTIYRWKAKWGGMTESDAVRLKQLEDENRRLKHLVADLTLDNHALKSGNGPGFPQPLGRSRVHSSHNPLSFGFTIGRLTFSLYLKRGAGQAEHAPVDASSEVP